MNFNISPIAFYPSRAAQQWRTAFYQRNIAVVTGEDLPPFIINDTPTTAPSTIEIYDPNTDTLINTVSATDIVAHTSTVNGVSVNSWIYQGTSSGIWGFNKPGYYYLKIGNYYSDILKFGPVNGDYVKLTYQFYDDIITPDGTLISKYIVYKQIFETDLWHPTYEINEEGKENAGIFYAMQQITKKSCGFSDIVNEAQLDTLNLTRMADNVQIEARTNGVIRTFSTNTFEIKSKWESDDVASIEVTFDLFNIIMKCQQSNVAPEPLPIPAPPEPPANYYIRGTVESGTNSVQFKINGTNQTVNCVNGTFSYGYNSPLSSFETSTYNNGYVGLSNVDKITTLDLSASCLFKQATTARFGQMTNCTSINFGNCTFENAVAVDGFCESNKKLTTISIPEATFASIDDNVFAMFADCSNVTSVSLPKSVQAYGAQAIFSGCTKLQTVDLSVATFAGTNAAGAMFQNCTALETVTMPAATFANATYFGFMFAGARGWFDAEMSQYEFNFSTVFPACTAKPTTIIGMFENGGFNSINLTGLDLSACVDMSSTFENSNLRGLTMNASQFTNVTNYRKTFKNCKYLNSTSTGLIDTISFAAATDCQEMFAGSGGGPADNLTFNAGTFANVTTCESMFENSGWKKIKFKRNVADFSNCANIAKMYYGSIYLNEIDMAVGAHFAQITDDSKMANAFSGLPSLVDLWAPQNQELNCSLSITQSPQLSYDGFLSVCMWMANRSGLAQKKLYVNSVAYNSLSTAEKTNLNNTYLQPKNWAIVS